MHFCGECWLESVGTEAVTVQVRVLEQVLLIKIRKYRRVMIW